jgi:predicted phage terminase large subunit-like protein
VPKCLVPIAGRALLDYWLDHLFWRGTVQRALINTHHLASQVWGSHLAVLRIFGESERDRPGGSGMGLIQLLKEQSRLSIIGRQPHTDKETRMARHQGRFEAGRILLPNEAAWLADFEGELLAFPSGRYDDQVDALLQFLDWYSANESYINPVLCAPILITRADMGLRPWHIDWSCRRRGLFRRDYEGTTLREHLGLPRPAESLFSRLSSPFRVRDGARRAIGHGTEFSIRSGTFVAALQQACQLLCGDGSAATDAVTRE